MTDPTHRLAALLSPLLLVAASCSAAPAGDSADSARSTPAPSAASARDGAPFAVEEVGQFDEPWALAVEPGTASVFVTERGGRIKFAQANGKMGFVSGVPKVDYGGQGGLGDFVFAPDYATSRHVYLSWVEAGDADTRGAVVGRAKLVCEDHDSCDLRDLAVIWRQTPKTSGRGHFAHRIAFAPDGQHLFIASGDRQKMAPAQDLANNLGTVVRLLPDGTPAPGNPFGAGDESRTANSVTRQIWSYGHRNILGMAFDGGGQLWVVEHGPQGGDELNLVRPGANYGWPVVSEGDHYGGGDISAHASRPEFAAPALSWTPVIAPGNFVIHSGRGFPEWRGQALIAGLKSKAIVRVALDGDRAREIGRYPMGARIRAVAEGPDGSLWVAEDGDNGRLLRLRPQG